MRDDGRPHPDDRAGTLIPLLGFLSGAPSCMCGHYSWLTVLLSGMFGAYGWRWSLRGRVLLRAPLAALPLLVLGKAVCDVLFFGHDPLLDSPPPLLLRVDPTLALCSTLLLAHALTVVATLLRRRDPTG